MGINKGRKRKEEGREKRERRTGEATHPWEFLQKWAPTRC